MNVHIFLFVKNKLNTILKSEKVLAICAAFVAIWSLYSAYSALGNEQCLRSSNEPVSKDFIDCPNLPAKGQVTNVQSRNIICEKQIMGSKEKGHILIDFSLLCLLLISIGIGNFTQAKKPSLSPPKIMVEHADDHGLKADPQPRKYAALPPSQGPNFL